MTRPEDALQEAVVAFLQYALPSDAVLFMIPNSGISGRAGKIFGAKMKRMGLLAGMPDLGVLHHTFNYFIELKTKKGRVSPAQRETHKRIRDAGGQVETCRTVDEVEQYLAGFIQLRAKVAA